MWFEATFVLSMLEPWEKILLRKSAQNIVKLSGATSTDLLWGRPVTVFFILFVLVFTGVLKYMPQHLAFLHRRGMYYLPGQGGRPASALAVGQQDTGCDAGVSPGVGAGLNAASWRPGGVVSSEGRETMQGLISSN